MSGCEKTKSYRLSIRVGCNGLNPISRLWLCSFWGYFGSVRSGSLVISVGPNQVFFSRSSIGGMGDVSDSWGFQLSISTCHYSDVIGHIQCDSLGGSTVVTHSGESKVSPILFSPSSNSPLTPTVLASQWCREMKVIQAFSWMLFISYTFALIILITLVSRAQAFGRFEIWSEPIRGKYFIAPFIYFRN